MHLFLFVLVVMVGLEPIPAVTEQESGYTLEISPVCQRIKTDNHFFGLWEMLEKPRRHETKTQTPIQKL